MSADLWAAFGNGDDPTKNPWSQPSPQNESHEIIIKPTAPGNLVPGESQDNLNSGGINKHERGSPALQSPWDHEPFLSPVYQPHIASRSSGGFHTEPEEYINWGDFTRSTEPVDPWTKLQSSTQAEVLWDADDTGADEDDFGDFEDPNQDVTTGLSRMAIVDESPMHSYKVTLGPIESGSKGRRRPETAAATSIDAKIKPSALEKPVAIQPKQATSLIDAHEENPAAAEEHEEWDEWSPKPVTTTQYSDAKSLQPQTRRQTTTSTPSQSSVPLSMEPTQRPSSRSRSRQRGPPLGTLPPTNIPPPSILISLLSTLISTLPAQISRAMESFTSISPSEGAAAAETALRTAVRKCLAALRVAARIVAGRKQRWKRDTHLAQSMRIGPALSSGGSSGGGGGGMKLSGVDKNEGKREEREVAEFVRVWRGQLGSVRRALASVNARIESDSINGNGNGSGGGGSSRKLELPAIGENMLVRTATDGVKSVKGCTLCGLKREERVDKVDGTDVFDGFNEWWVEHWGHTECRAFWYQHEKYLQQR